MGVNCEAVYVLGEKSIRSRSGRASHAGRDGRSAGGTEIKEGGIRGIETRIFRIGQNGFRSGGKSAAEQRVVNKGGAQARGGAAAYMADVIAKLIFFLLAHDGKSRDGSDELLLTEAFEAATPAAPRSALQ